MPQRDAFLWQAVLFSTAARMADDEAARLSHPPEENPT